ncbi:hypothetical protein IW262DRAFT_1481971 [Armillaria fumosa]|nr:hypothetical protein IW262DRAFT_1481971 [Armillaria fumosa]
MSLNLDLFQTLLAAVGIPLKAWHCSKPQTYLSLIEADSDVNSEVKGWHDTMLLERGIKLRRRMTGRFEKTSQDSEQGLSDSNARVFRNEHGMVAVQSQVPTINSKIKIRYGRGDDTWLWEQKTQVNIDVAKKEEQKDDSPVRPGIGLATTSLIALSPPVSYFAALHRNLETFLSDWKYLVELLTGAFLDSSQWVSIPVLRLTTGGRANIHNKEVDLGLDFTLFSFV